MSSDQDIRPYYATGPALTPQQLHEAMMHTTPALIDYLGGNVVLLASYGWDSGLHAALWHKEMQIAITHLDRFIRDSIRQEIVRPGFSELVIQSPENMIRVYFTRDGVSTSGDDLILQEKLWLSHPWKTYPMKMVDGKEVAEPNLWS